MQNQLVSLAAALALGTGSYTTAGTTGTISGRAGDETYRRCSADETGEPRRGWVRQVTAPAHG